MIITHTSEVSRIGMRVKKDEVQDGDVFTITAVGFQIYKKVGNSLHYSDKDGTTRGRLHSWTDLYPFKEFVIVGLRALSLESTEHFTAASAAIKEKQT